MKDSPPAPAPVDIWTGFSIGGGIGVGFMDADVNGRGRRVDRKAKKCIREYLDEEETCFHRDEDYEGRTFRPKAGGFGVLQRQRFDLSGLGDAGFLGTVQIGYDHRLGQRWVAGVFADAEWSDISASASYGGRDSIALDKNYNRAFEEDEELEIFGGSSDVNVETDWGYTLGGRLGKLVGPSQNTLIYGLVGYTHVNLDNPKATINFRHPLSGLPLDIPGTSMNMTLPDEIDGLTVGGGVEVALGRGWSIKTEYRFSSLDGGSASASDRRFFCHHDCEGTYHKGLLIADDAEADLDADIHTVRAVLTYRFGKREPAPAPLK